jgi:hypothetical protein
MPTAGALCGRRDLVKSLTFFFLTVLILALPSALCAQEDASGDWSAHNAPGRWDRTDASSAQGRAQGTGKRWDNDIPMSAAGTALSKEAVKVTIDASHKMNPMMPWALGANASLDDGLLINPDTVGLLQAAGITTLRYPGRTANTYHWSVFKSNKNGLGDGPYLSPNNHFGYFSMLIGPQYLAGTAILTVNFGSNLQGTGGGEPQEAAAWVAYCNGKVGDSKVIGKDSTGFDWKTVGFWAGMRAASPLSDDDGYNFLRIGQAQPIGIVYWEIGNLNYRNGFYGEKDKDGGAEADFHTPYGANAAEAAKARNRNALLSPTAFGKNALAFIKAMKDVDPDIRVGIPLLAPGIDTGYTPDWNAGVIKEVGPSFDFASVRWQSVHQAPPDWQTLDAAATLDTVQQTAATLTGGVKEAIDKFGGKRTRPAQVMVTDFGIPSWIKIPNPVAEALYTADAYVALMKYGTVSIDIGSLHDKYTTNAMLNDNQTPGASFFGVQMVHLMMGIKDQLLDSRSANSMLTVHSALRKDGSIAIMLINKDPKTVGTAKINVVGTPVGANGKRFDYGAKSPDPKHPVVGSEFKEGGNNMTVQVQPYSISVIILPAR